MTFEKLGIYRDYPYQEDQGRFVLTGDEADRMVFKASQLRNVAKTGPWYHDGALDTLEEAVLSCSLIDQADNACLLDRGATANSMPPCVVFA